MQARIAKHRKYLFVNGYPSRQRIVRRGRGIARLTIRPLILQFALLSPVLVFGLTFDGPSGENGTQAASAPVGAAGTAQTAAGALPDEPKPRNGAHTTPAPNPCNVKNAGASMASTVVLRALAAGSTANLKQLPSLHIVNVVVCIPHAPPIVNWYARFLTGPEVKPLTPREKGILAAKNVMDPFNLITIAGESGISVAFNSHSVYGPGFFGWSKEGGVSLTQDMTGEFFGTFLIPSIAHQDPHYHRMPKATIPRRILHCIDQVAWTQGDSGKGMVNYADLVGFIFDDAVDDLYVPGQQTNFRASAERYGIGLAIAPTDNFITEFLPDIASHIHVHVVLVQRIIDQVARTGDTP